MNEEMTALLQAYQGRINQLTAQNIAFEAKLTVLSKQLEDKQAQIDGGEISETPPSQ
jgi:hypothetical protein|tara:strand:- start:474 stop:644 length:171 start_codon:yes stop_codon:yes gene_type:complete